MLLVSSPVPLHILNLSSYRRFPSRQYLAPNNLITFFRIVNLTVTISDFMVGQFGRSEAEPGIRCYVMFGSTIQFSIFISGTLSNSFTLFVTIQRSLEIH